MTPPTLNLTADMTVADAVAALQRAFVAAGLDDAGRDARLIVQMALALPNGGHILHAATPVGDRAAAIAAAARRRLAREPVSRIFASRGFYGRDFEISPATLDPRPDTETVISAALELMATTSVAPGTPLRILDVGTGSGCILVTLLAELSAAIGLGTDISAPALTVAEANAARHAVADRARFAVARSVPENIGQFDLVVSNPPYISTDCIEGLAPEVSCYDPLEALDGGPDGLDVYREILAGLTPATLTGWCLFEVGYDQAEQVKSLIEDAVGSRMPRRRVRIETFADLAGHTRCVAWTTRM